MKLTEKQMQFINECKQTGVIPCNVSRENKKLKPTKETGFIIWNIPAKATCPYATDECAIHCYARKAEIAYPDCLPCRKRNLKESMQKDFARRMAFTILSIAKGTRKKKLIVRIHESGDFYNKAYVMAWLEIMKACDGLNIVFIAYTKSFPFFDGMTLPQNFALRASIWSDTPDRFIEMIKRNGWNTYSAVEKFTDNDSFHQCRCEDCANCGACWNNEIHEINCEIH